MTRTLDRGEARRRVLAQRQAFLGALGDLQHHLEGSTHRVEETIAGAKAIAKRSNQVVKESPWPFVLGAFLVGILLSRPWVRRAPPTQGSAMQLLPAPRPPPFFRSVARGLAQLLVGAAVRWVTRQS